MIDLVKLKLHAQYIEELSPWEPGKRQPPGVIPMYAPDGDAIMMVHGNLGICAHHGIFEEDVAKYLTHLHPKAVLELIERLENAEREMVKDAVSEIAKMFEEPDPDAWQSEKRPYIYVEEETGVVVIVRDTPALVRPPKHDEEPDDYRVMYEPEVSEALYHIITRCLREAEPNTTHELAFGAEATE